MHGEHCCNQDEIIRGIKQKCFICGRPLHNTLERYLVRGNACDGCTTLVNRTKPIKGRRINRNNKRIYGKRNMVTGQN